MRLYVDDEELLAKLCEKLEVNETEVIRRALALLGRLELKP